MVDMHPGFGVMTQPKVYGVSIGIREGRVFGLDNGAFNNGFNEVKFFEKIKQLDKYMNQCLFITIPDVLGDAKATLDLFDEWYPKVKGMGELAFVAQDGQEHLDYPTNIDWIFIGGTTKFKMGAAGKKCIQKAHDLNLKIHVGRVNSMKRFRYFRDLGCHTVDGTTCIYNPTTAKERLTRVLEEQEWEIKI
jgi:hypothetical protein